jgi:hypothetical protein
MAVLQKLLSKMTGGRKLDVLTSGKKLGVLLTW